MKHQRTIFPIAAIAISILVIKTTFLNNNHDDFGSLATPWQCIGGCGAGGSGGGSNGIKWIGNEMGGSTLRLEVLPKLNFGKNFAYLISAPRLTYHPTYATELGMVMPIGFKIAEVHYRTNLEPQTVVNGGRGDLTLDILQKFGSTGQFSWQAALTFPTGQWDAKRGSDLSKAILPYTMQMGQGVYAATLGLFYTVDAENALFLFDGFFTYPFAVRFDKKNQYLDTDYRHYKNTTINRERFYYRHIIKPYGENDRGDYIPPSLSFDAVYAYRSIPGITQSLQFFYASPLGIRWVHSYVPTEYNPLPDPDHRAWDLVISYGVEFSNNHLPLFLGVGLPIHDRKDPHGIWNAPDWENIGQEWIFAFGVKTALF